MTEARQSKNAAHYLKKKSLVEDVKRDPESADVSPKMKALLNVAGKTQMLGKRVRPSDIAHAKSAGASEREIHDTVLIAAAFCMFNRYVNGLATFAPKEDAAYVGMAERICHLGYLADRA